MPKIILASASAQRKKLLKLTGLKFSVHPSRVKEIHQVKSSITALVKKNALLKARDVASKIQEGIVMGADTLVYSGRGRQIIGKPRNLKEAKKILKILTSRPQWVYTGVALVDTKTRKTLVDYEKTKIYMQKLSDREISQYHRKTNPIDKAGGFDIEGRGGLFIRRIEGCYSNVIGLPLAKLRLMLKKFGVSVFSLLFIFFIAGCSTEFNLATNQQETVLYGTEKEVKIGEAVSRQFDNHFKINTDVDVNERVTNILRRLVAVCDRKELVYTIKVIDDKEELNAVSLPGGYIYVYKGLIDKLDNDDQLACVIAHEVGHVTAKHAIKKLESIYGYTLLQLLAIQTRDANVARGVNAAFMSMFFEYSQQDEFLADKLGIKYAKAAGFNADEIANVLKKLKEAQKKGPIREFSYWRTHPFLSERMAMVNQELTGELEFKDYLNIMGNE